MLLEVAGGALGALEVASFGGGAGVDVELL